MPFKVGLLILMQHDVEKAFEFYKTLGLSPKFHIKDRWAEFKLGNTKLVLCPVSELIPDRHTGIVLEVENLEVLHQELTNKGITFLTSPKTAPHGIMASIKDPGNNILDLYQPTPEKVTELVRNSQACCKTDQCKTREQCCKKSCDNTNGNC